MDLPIKFPDHHEEARKRAAEFQRLSPDERWREMGAMMALGWAMVKASPHRAAIERRMEEQEQEWQRIQKELLESAWPLKRQPRTALTKKRIGITQVPGNGSGLSTSSTGLRPTAGQSTNARTSPGRSRCQAGRSVIRPSAGDRPALAETFHANIAGRTIADEKQTDEETYLLRSNTEVAENGEHRGCSGLALSLSHFFRSAV